MRTSGSKATAHAECCRKVASHASRSSSANPEHAEPRRSVRICFFFSFSPRNLNFQQQLLILHSTCKGKFRLAILEYFGKDHNLPFLCICGQDPHIDFRAQTFTTHTVVIYCTTCAIIYIYIYIYMCVYIFI